MVHIIGGGLAGSEAAWQAASRGVPVTLHEMRPVRATAVHKTGGLAELVCSNSFRGDKLDNAVGLLKEEMRRLGSLVMRAADAHRVPAGAALAVDRERFSQAITDAIAAHPLITVVREEVARIPDDPDMFPLVIATGAGAIGNRTIGATGVGGMLVGTVIGVLVIPGLYYLFGKMAGGRKFLMDEVDEPLSELLEHGPLEAPHEGA